MPSEPIPTDPDALDAAVQLYHDCGARLLSLLHVGGDGLLKTLDFAPRDDDHLRAILRRGERADGSSLFRGMGIRAAASDILLRPRPADAFADPFSATPTLCVRCSHCDRDGALLDVSPDTIVRRAALRLNHEFGIDLWAHGEVEFFLGRRAEEYEAGGRDEGGYHAASPVLFGQSLRRQAMTVLSAMGLPIKYGHGEVGYISPRGPGDWIWEQHEIELDLLPLPEAADAIVLTAWVLRTLAHDAGLQANLAPVIGTGHAGNGLHIHLSPRRDGVIDPIRGSDGALTGSARRLITGLVEHGGALMAFGNREHASFTRLQQGLEAPEHLTWGDSDRSCLVRLPIAPTVDNPSDAIVPTVEFRLADGSAHPHLLLAGIAQAFADADELAQPSTAAQAPELPRNRQDVARHLESARTTLTNSGIFPMYVIDRMTDQLTARTDSGSG